MRGWASYCRSFNFHKANPHALLQNDKKSSYDFETTVFWPRDTSNTWTPRNPPTIWKHTLFCTQSYFEYMNSALSSCARARARALQAPSKHNPWKHITKLTIWIAHASSIQAQSLETWYKTNHVDWQSLKTYYKTNHLDCQSKLNPRTTLRNIPSN